MLNLETIGQLRIALEACETQLRLTAGFIYDSGLAERGSGSWRDVADACSVQARLARRELERTPVCVKSTGHEGACDGIPLHAVSYDT